MLWYPQVEDKARAGDAAASGTKSLSRSIRVQSWKCNWGLRCRVWVLYKMLREIICVFFWWSKLTAAGDDQQRVWNLAVPRSLDLYEKVKDTRVLGIQPCFKGTSQVPLGTQNLKR